MDYGTDRLKIECQIILREEVTIEMPTVDDGSTDLWTALIPFFLERIKFIISSITARVSVRSDKIWSGGICHFAAFVASLPSRYERTMRKIGTTISITTGIVPAVPGLPYVIRAYILAAAPRAMA